MVFILFFFTVLKVFANLKCTIERWEQIVLEYKDGVL